MAGNSERNTLGRYLGNGNVYLWNASIHDCRNSFGLRLGHSDGRAFSFATAARVGRLCSPFSRMRAGKHIIPKVEANGADVLFV